MELKKEILRSVSEFREKGFLIKEIKPYEPENCKNELVFFFKPEVLLPQSVNLGLLLDVTFEKFEEFDVKVESLSVLSGEYLKKHDIMARHYGVINRIARFGKRELTTEALEKFKEIFGVEAEKANLLGAFEFLERYKDFNAFSLNVLWENLENKKLASGTYCEKVRVGEETVYLLNGFHPYQLLHFTRKEAFIVVMAVASDTNWKRLRQDFIGATNPEKAKEGSLRRILLEKKEELRIPMVTQGYNGFHLSAGPVEALAELLRFCSNYETGNLLTPEKTVIGKKFLKAFGKEIVEKLMENPKVNYNGRLLGVFDITEELDTDDAIEVLKGIPLE